jgi:hypothetical protein
MMIMDLNPPTVVSSTAGIAFLTTIRNPKQVCGSTNVSLRIPTQALRAVSMSSVLSLIVEVLYQCS